MKYRLLLQQARALIASGLAHTLLQEHRVAALSIAMSRRGGEIYARHDLRPGGLVGETRSDDLCTQEDVEDFEKVLLLVRY